MGSQSQNDIMLNLQILRICQVLNVEEVLHFLHTLLRQIYDLVFLISR